MENMKQKVISLSIAVFGLLYFFLAINVQADDKSWEAKNELVVYFKSNTFELDQKSVEDIIEKMDPGKNYRVEGYACSNGDKTQEYLPSEAERRSGIVRKYLIEKGFPSNNLSIIAYDYNSECKVILKAIE
jgi:outer membrane protein OmpA-like peptidoglycan-associated protein